ncbi:leucine--tRNA ligase [Patescibacteria group bacterium]|nr:leucine--tRNA ligase [Patescibacteria group bacterium]
MKAYDHKKIEKKWQKDWDKKKIYQVKDKVKGKENFYTLVEFSYPSGNLHVGHWYAFGVTDIFARFKRMKGFNVLYPMGFDAFGLPAENAAIKSGKDPKVLTYKQMDTMRKQLRSMGAMFDWEREVITCDPSYYKWTQWMFNQFLKNDLVYREVTKVNWCPVDKTILANEQVVDGCCGRCGNAVEQRDQEQWMLRITKYADRLVNDLEKLAWPEEIKSAQRNWIGKSKGAEIDFKITGDKAVKIFTTRPDTIFGATYMVLAPEHPLIGELNLINKEEVKNYIEVTKKKSDLERQQSKEKTGVELKGVKAVNPATKAEIPVWIADYVLAGYGTGAIMAVPSDDARDKEFAQKFNLPIIEEYQKAGFNDFGKSKTSYKLRDWGISRQRYWGTPIPIVYDPSGKAHPIPDKHLPWLLPKDVDYKPDGTAPLARSKELVKRTEKIFGKGWKPEVETMDTFVDSSWYFYRYLDAKNKKSFADMKKMDSWMPLDLYMGGAEHTTMHLLYSRFWTKALYDLGLVKDDEAYTVRRNRGLILGPDGEKMSKSRGNVVNPDEIVERLGADTVRMYLAFMGPYGVTVNYPWDPNGVVGVRRFLERVWKLQEKISASSSASVSLLHKVIKKMTEDMAEYKFNTSISQMMVLINAWEKQESISKEEYKTLLRLLAPFAPHIAEELWNLVGEKKSINLASWPEWDESMIVETEVKIAIQINGKLRGELTVGADATEGEVRSLALKDEGVIKHLAGAEPKRVIYVKNRLINIVV